MKNLRPILLMLLLTMPSSIFSQNEELLLLTVATESTEGFQRYLRSVQIHNLKGKVSGMGQRWKGGDMNYPGGGFKINLLKKEVEQYKDDKDLILIFSDSYDVVFTDGKEKLVEAFKEFKAGIVFGAEGFCWPDKSLEDSYPSKVIGKRFLNSGGFMGYADKIYQMVHHREIADTDDDQLYYTKIYLDSKLREKLNVKLDSQSKIFQNLNGAINDVELRFETDGNPYIYNIAFNTRPVVIHGNGASKLALNYLANYVPKAWNTRDQCTMCLEDNFNINAVELDEYPVVLLGLFVEGPTPFLEEFFRKILNLNYPKNKIHLYVHNIDSYHDKDVDNFIKQILEDDKYSSHKLIPSSVNLKIWHAKNEAIEHCKSLNCDYYFNVDSVAHLDNPNTLKLLMEQNRPIVAPLLVRPFKAWSNFWGALSSEGFYSRSADYMEIVQNTRRGLWNVPFITSSYLIKKDVLSQINYINGMQDADMAFCANARNKDIFMHVSNRHDFGHLINNDDYVTTNNENRLNDFWEVINNPLDWEGRYLHENYSQTLEEDFPISDIKQPCPDVFQMPLTNERFAKELIEIMETNGKWSDGSNQDIRLDGGYEAVPTRDIHMNQVNFEKEWLEILRKYVMPLQQKIYIGYNNDPPRAIMNFVVRYRPDEQPELRPHHDSSTYTINLALNSDYEGGGCRFLRYECSVIKNKIGWILMHPGRLTHYHEGLKTTKGTRYIMVTFIDP